VTPSPKVLYVVYWGAGEPLGQSLVVPAVKTLAALGAKITLITFEKPHDLNQPGYISNIKQSLSDNGIEWLPQRYHKQPKIPATVRDIAAGVVQSLASRTKRGFDIVHARTFVGGLIGMVVAPLIGARYVYHNEGFYPDEQVDGGVWKSGSYPHRLARRLEERMYSRADGIIAMSFRGKREIERREKVISKMTPVIVVPSCVDLELFHRNGSSLSEAALTTQTLRLVYSGSVGGRYILDRVGEFVSEAAKEFGGVHLDVLTRADKALVETMLSQGGLDRNLWSVTAMPYKQMPERISRSQAGLFFLAQGISEHGCSPTKIGEYWAMGLPVITTPNVSDTDDIIRRLKVGVIVEDHSVKSYRKAAYELRGLLDDAELATRCRRAAEEHYALLPACERQMAMYDSIL